MNHLPPHRSDEYRDQLRIMEWLDAGTANLSTEATRWLYARMLDFQYSDDDR